MSVGATTKVFMPTKDEAWTKTEVSFNIIQVGIYKATVYPALVLTAKPKMDGKTWKLIESLDLKKFKTVGDIEIFALKILKKTVKGDNTHKHDVHTKLKNGLKTYAEEGLLKASSLLLDLAKSK